MAFLIGLAILALAQIVLGVIAIAVTMAARIGKGGLLIALNAVVLTLILLQRIARLVRTFAAFCLRVICTYLVSGWIFFNVSTEVVGAHPTSTLAGEVTIDADTAVLDCLI